MGFFKRFRRKKKKEKETKVEKTEEEILQENLEKQRVQFQEKLKDDILYKACHNALKEMPVEPRSKKLNSSCYIIDKDMSIVDENVEDDILFHDAEALWWGIYQFMPADAHKVKENSIRTGVKTEAVKLTLDDEYKPKLTFDNKEKTLEDYRDSPLIEEIYRGIIGLLLARGSKVTDDDREKILDNIMEYGKPYLKIRESIKSLRIPESLKHGYFVVYFPDLALNAMGKYIAKQPVEEQKSSK